MREGWEYKKFTDVCDVQYGYAFDSKCFTDDESAMPLIRIRDVMRGYSETFYNGAIPEGYTINEGDYLVGMDGEFNIGRWGKRAGLLNQRVCKMTSSSPLLHNQYMYYFMKVCLKSIEDETPFVTVKHLSAKRINQIQIPLPPLSVQQSIVAELDEINNLLSLKWKELETYDKLAQSLFYEMFGDPVENEKGWEVKKLENFCSTITKGTTPTSIGFSFTDDGINFVKVESFQSDGSINCNTLAHISTDCNDSMARSQLMNKDILICIAGATVGKLAKVDASILPANTNQACAIVRLKDELNLINDFLYGYFRYAYIELVVDGLKKGVAQPNLSLGQIKNFDIILPPLPLQQLFATRIEAIEAQKANVKVAIEKLETLLAARMQYWFE